MKRDKEPDPRKKSDKPTDLSKPRRIYGRPPVDMSDDELEAWAEEFIKALRRTEEGKAPEAQEGGETA